MVNLRKSSLFFVILFTLFSNCKAMDKNKKAIAAFTAAIKNNPKHPASYYHRGRAYNKKGEYDKVIADFTMVIKLAPQFASVYYMRGFAYDKKGKYGQARADCSKALKINPQYKAAKELIRSMRRKR